MEYKSHVKSHKIIVQLNTNIDRVIKQNKEVF